MTKDMEKTDERPVTRLVPSVDVFERKDDVVVVADLPGVSEKGLEVTLDKGLLTIEGKAEARAEDETDYEYVRSFTLSDRVDRSGIKASVKDGVLTLTMPYAEEAKAKKIPITFN